MISPTPVSAAALMTGCLRASRPGHQHLPSRPPRPGFVFFSAISACTFVTMPVPSRPRAERFTRVEGYRNAAPATSLARPANLAGTNHE
jgi:hypothetical protein